jgi:hypothetical protein
MPLGDAVDVVLLRNLDFALLFVGQEVSRLGDRLYTAAISWLAWGLTHAAVAVAVVTAVANAPAFASCCPAPC